MGACSVKGWAITGSRADAYAAERMAELYEGKHAARLWRSGEGADGFGALFQVFAPGIHRGKRARFSAVIRARGVTGRAALCFRVDGRTSEGARRSLAFDNMEARPAITGTTAWARESCVLEVAPEATALFVSALLVGAGEISCADARIEIVDDTVPVTDMLAIHTVAPEPTNLDFSEI